jgi:hypothetical protein
VPRLRSLCLAWGTLAAAVAVAGGQVGGSSPAPVALGAVPAPATDPEGASAVTALGRVLPLPTSDGRVVDVTVLGVRLRAGAPRLIDVRLRYELRRGTAYRMNPALDTQLVDGSHQLLTVTSARTPSPALKPALLRRLTPVTGWVTFVRPTAAKVVRVQVTLEGGNGPHTGQWRVSPQSTQ